MNAGELKEIIRKHRLWLLGDSEGIRADLRFADLQSADLRSAGLQSADLRSAGLQSADLQSADLQSADLQSANLRFADLQSANLRSADLRFADLRFADLQSANLRSAKVNWQSHALVGEILWRAADTTARRMLAAFTGRMTGWCWGGWAEFDHPETPWAVAEMAKWVQDGDGCPDVLLDRIKALASK